MKWWEMKVEATVDIAETIAALWQEWPDIQGVSMEGRTTDAPLHPEYGEFFDEALANTGQVVVAAYVPDTTAKESILLRLDQMWQQMRDAGLQVDHVVDTLSLSQLDESSWESAWKEDFHPIPVGERFVIVPKWEVEGAGDDTRLPIVLEPGMAFGTGTHATTRLCLQALEGLAEVSGRVLDVGCGTAILSIAAAKAGAMEVHAVDIDPVAVEVAKENVRDNGVDSVVSVRQGDLMQHAAGTYDLVIANILRDIVIALAPDAYQYLRQHGKILVSGFVASQEAVVREALTKAGFEIVRRQQEEDWLALIGEKI